MTATLVAPKTCRKCNGSGDYTYATGAVGTCAGCTGAGVVETNRAAIAARKADALEGTRLHGVIKALAETVRPFQGRPSVSMASDGLYLLRANDPARYTKAVASLEAGRLDAVTALVEYFNANR